MKKNNFDLIYLKRCKYSSPEQKLEWLENALEFARTEKILKKDKHKSNPNG